MTNTEERQVHSKQIPQVEPPNTTATAEKLEVLNNILKFMGQAWNIQYNKPT